MSEVEKLRALLAEARHLTWTCGLGSCENEVCAVAKRIDAALAEPVEPLSDCICTGPWVTGHRHTDICREFRAMRAEVARLRWGNEMACENTPTRGCECPGCGLARERAERGEA